LVINTVAAGAFIVPAAITEMSRAPIVHIRNEDILSRFKLGIDVGGTFTDFFLVSDEGKAMMHKTLSTPEDPSIGFIKGIKDLAGKLNLDESTFFEKIDTIVHGTTVATNALLTRNGANTAFDYNQGASAMLWKCAEESEKNNTITIIKIFLHLWIEKIV